MKKISKMLVDMARFYQYDLGEKQMEMYTDVLSQQPEEVVLRAGKEYMQNMKNTKFPVPPHLILKEYLPNEPDDHSNAKEVAGRVVDAVTRFGWNNAQSARTYIGEVGWKVVERFGGWLKLCEGLGTTIDQTSFYAQARELALVQVELSRAGRLDEPIDFPERKNIESENAKRLASTVRTIESSSNRPLTQVEIGQLKEKIDEVSGINKRNPNHGNLTVAGDLIKSILPQKDLPK